MAFATAARVSAITPRAAVAKRGAVRRVAARETENKSTVVTYVAGGVVALWLASSIVGSINSVPLLHKLMELIGLGYSCWFVYRYLLFKDSRSELGDEVEAFKAKISGEDEA